MQAETRPANRSAILAVLLTGQFMANIDTAVANVAGPSIGADLHASAARSAWSCPGTSSRSPYC